MAQEQQMAQIKEAKAIIAMTACAELMSSGALKGERKPLPSTGLTQGCGWVAWGRGDV